MYFENSKVPVILSKFSPIEITAITLGPMVFSRGEMSDQTKNHECIHWQQYIETGIAGFIVLYFIFWLYNLIKFRDGRLAYMSIPFEQEAYTHDGDLSYLEHRKRYAWWPNGN